MMLESNVTQAIKDFDDIKAAIEERKGAEMIPGTPTSNYGKMIRELPEGDDFTITDAAFLFYLGRRLDAVDEILPKLKGVVSTYGMFYDCADLTSVDLSSFDTSNVTDMSMMFQNCAKLAALDVSNWDTSNVTDMLQLFSGCRSLTVLDVSNWDTSNVLNMGNVFKGCTKLAELDVSNWDTSNVTSMMAMFYDCKALTRLDVSNWDTSNVTSMPNMFYNCTALAEILGFSATNIAGTTLNFPTGSATTRTALSRLTFRTDLPEGVYSIRSAINIKYCSFTDDGLAETFATLPDVSGLGLSSSYTTITITGNPCVTDGTLQDTTRELATAKGWTLVE